MKFLEISISVTDVSSSAVGHDFKCGLFFSNFYNLHSDTQLYSILLTPEVSQVANLKEFLLTRFS